MKGIVFIASLFLITSILFSACDKKAGYTKEIEELVENSNLDFKLTEDEMNLDYQDKYEEIGGFGGYLLKSEDGLTRYTVSGYPDCLDDYKLTGFTTYNSKYTIYGFSVGGNPEDAVAILNEHLYKKVDEGSSQNTRIYKRGKIFIQIFTENDEIKSLSISLDITNKKNVEF